MQETLRNDLLGLFEGKLTRPMELYLETCSRCGVCTPACHAYASMPLPKYSPAHRAEVVRRIYKKYFKAQGKILPGLGQAKALDETALEELKEAAYSCTGCRRCMVYCPFGIDTQQIMSIAKLLLIGAGMEPEMLTMLADMSVAKGENIDSMKPGFIEGLKRLESKVLEKWRSEAGSMVIPTDVEEPEKLYVALAGAHSIIPAAAIFNAAHEKWSLSFFEAVNFGAFVGDPTKTAVIMNRIADEAKRLKAKEVVVCECGTAYRVLKQKEPDFPFKVSTLTDVIARYIKEGRIKIKEGSVTRPTVFHDPCQVARNAGDTEAARYILGKLCADYREMSKDPRYNWCCGGGGGLVALGEETFDFRMKSSKVKVDQIRSMGVGEGDILATSCENCHTQLSDLSKHYKLNMEVRFLSSMVADVLEE